MKDRALEGRSEISPTPLTPKLAKSQFSNPSGLDLPLLSRLSYEVGQRKSETIKVVNRGEEKVRVHIYVDSLDSLDSHRGDKNFFFTSRGSLIPFTRANAQWVFHGFT